MKSIDEEIEKILSKEYKEHANENEGVSLAKSPGMDKNIEYINFEDDRNGQGKELADVALKEASGGGTNQGRLLEQDVFSLRPFAQTSATAPKEGPSTPKNNSIELIDLEVLLGLSGKPGVETQHTAFQSVGNVSDTGMINAVRKSKLIENVNEDHKQKVEEMNQFIDDLFSNKYLEKRVFEHQRQNFGESLFDASNLNNECHSRPGNAKQFYQSNLRQETDRMPHSSPVSSLLPLSSDSSRIWSSIEEAKSFTMSEQPRMNKNEHIPNLRQGRSASQSNVCSMPSMAPDCLLFRNPTLRQNSFNPQAYCKIKRRRRISSNTWCSAGNLLAFHPSKLSSFEFVHGSMNLTPRPGINPGNFVFAPKQGPESSKVIESFKKQMTKIDFDNVTVHELKNIMKDYGLNPNGKKREMIDRLRNTLKELGAKYEEDQSARVADCREDPLYEKYFF